LIDDMQDGFHRPHRQGSLDGGEDQPESTEVGVGWVSGQEV